MPSSQETCSLYHFQKHNKAWVASYRKKKKNPQNKSNQKIIQPHICPTEVSSYRSAHTVSKFHLSFLILLWRLECQKICPVNRHQASFHPTENSSYSVLNPIILMILIQVTATTFIFYLPLVLSINNIISENPILVACHYV